MNTTLKAYQINDELYAAGTAEQAASDYRDMTGEAPEEEPRELSEAELDAAHPEFGEDEQPTGGTTTVRKMLAEHGDEHGWLAGPTY